MRKKDVINFAPEGVKSRKRFPGYVFIIIIVCIAAFSASMFIILAKNDFNIGKALGAREAESVSETGTQAVSSESTTALIDVNEEKQHSSVNFLIICSDGKELTFCQYINVIPEENKIKIKPVSPQLNFDFGEVKMPLGKAFSSVSVKDLCTAFEKRGMPVSKYIYLTEENFVRLMKTVGTTPIEIKGGCEFNVDAVKYTFREGTQNLTSDMLLKYMKYSSTGDDLLRIQADAAADIFRTHFSRKNFDRGEDMFSSLINCVDSNITAFDYNEARSVIEKMTDGGTEISVIS